MARLSVQEFEEFTLEIDDQGCKVLDKEGGTLNIHPAVFDRVLSLLGVLHSMEDFPERGMAYPKLIKNSPVKIRFTPTDDLFLAIGDQMDPELKFNWDNSTALSSMIRQAKTACIDKKGLR